jgi:hypothetical protein
MPNLTSVGIASGVPNSGTGTVSTLDAVMALLGEVQASPTSNTALDRLKTLHTDLVALEALVDSVETLLGGTQVIGTGTNSIGYTKDDGPSWTTVWGVSAAPFTSADQHSGVASVTDAPTSGQKLVIDDLFVSVDTAMSVTFKCETSGAIIFGPVYLPANGSFQFTPRGKGNKLATADKKLQVLTSVAGNITVSAGYHSEA